MPPTRAPRGAILASRLATGPLAFFVAGVLDVTAAWGRWAAQELAGRLARRLARR